MMDSTEVGRVGLTRSRIFLGVWDSSLWDNSWAFWAVHRDSAGCNSVLMTEGRRPLAPLAWDRLVRDNKVVDLLRLHMGPACKVAAENNLGRIH
jgi:hypothetical protein